MNELVSITDQKVVTTSLIIAEAFEKQHAHVMRAIRDLECSDGFRQSNFGLSSYLNEQNKTQPCYNITRDGFTFLAMGFNGKKAAQFKEAFIAAFNRMEQALLSGAAEVKRFEFHHHRATSAPNGLDLRFTSAMLKDIPAKARLLAIEELTGRSMASAISALQEDEPQLDTELEGMSRILDLLLDGDSRYDFSTGLNGLDQPYVEGGQLEIGSALSDLAQELEMEEMLDSRSRFYARFRDKKLLKKIGWEYETSGFQEWKTVRFTKVRGV